MVPAIIAIFVLAFSALQARAQLDLTPVSGNYKMEALTLKNISFHDGDKTITYDPPHGWTCSGGRASMSMTIPKYSRAEAYINSAPRLRISAISDLGAKQLVAEPALLQLPRGFTNLKVNSLQVNPLQIDSHQTVEAQVTYDFYGQTCARSILLIDRNGSEVSCVLDCLGPDFKVLHTEFMHSLYSFENL